MINTVQIICESVRIDSESIKSKMALQLFYTPTFQDFERDVSLINSPVYGVQEDGPVPCDDDESAVYVSPVSVNLSGDRVAVLNSLVNPLSEDIDFGVSKYMFKCVQWSELLPTPKSSVNG